MTHATHNRSVPSISRAAVPPGAEIVVASVLLTAGWVALFVGYVMLTISNSSQKIEARGAQQRIVTLREEGQKLEIEALAGRSLDAIESRVSELGLVPVDRVEYVDLGGGAVAVR